MLYRALLRGSGRRGSWDGVKRLPSNDSSRPARVATDDRFPKVGTVRKQGEKMQLSEEVEALDYLVQQGSNVPASLFYRVLQKCVAQKNLVLGRRVHDLTLKGGYESNTFLANHIMRMYASQRRLQEATMVFTNVTVPDTFMWCSIISAHTEHGQPAHAINLYRQMRLSTVEPNSYVFVAVLKACLNALNIEAAKQVHADIMGSVNESDMIVCNCLVDVYAKCGSLVDARRVFDNMANRDVVTWTAMIGGYAQHGFCQEALDLYALMQQEGLVLANSVTFVCLLQACGSVRALKEGKQLHQQIQVRGLDADILVGSCMLDMYAKCGSLEDARSVFDSLATRDVVTWTAMIAGYVQHGHSQEALSLYSLMQQEGIILADSVTFVCLLKACARVGALHHGKQLHSQILERVLEGDVVVGNCLVDMYAKCGSLVDAQRVFDTLPIKDVVTWNAVLNACAERGDSQMAMQYFEDMQQQCVEPDEVTFSCLLVACSHNGLVNEGKRYFKMLVEDYGIVPSIYHYNCMVDLLGRFGYLDEAETFLRTMPSQNDVIGWRSLLSACKIHSDIDRGRRCFDHLTALEPTNATAYVLLMDIYANAGRWRDVDLVESLRKSAGACKEPAKACIEVKNRVHEFEVGQERSDLSSKLRSMNLILKGDGGHVPHTELVQRALSDAQKEDALCGHAEKLALAYGLLHTPDGAPLLVTKNLRMCNDCHSATKALSRVEKRDIIVRDGHRQHHFVDGVCSCGDQH